MSKDKFVSNVVEFGVSQCMSCKNYLGDWKCKAYKEGIPIKIAANDVKHDKPLLGDGGYQYEKKD